LLTLSVSVVIVDPNAQAQVTDPNAAAAAYAAAYNWPAAGWK